MENRIAFLQLVVMMVAGLAWLLQEPSVGKVALAIALAFMAVTKTITLVKGYEPGTPRWLQVGAIIGWWVMCVAVATADIS